MRHFGCNQGRSHPCYFGFSFGTLDSRRLRRQGPPQSCRARWELLSLAILQTDLGASPADRIYSLDASPTGGGIVYCKLPPHVVGEFWRRCEQRGYYTMLLSARKRCSRRFLNFRAHVQYPLLLSQGRCKKVFFLISLNCFSLWETGLRAGSGSDIVGRRLLGDTRVYQAVLSLALRKVVRDWHCGPPCLSFGILRRPRVRSKSQPAGFCPSEPFTALHNCFHWSHYSQGYISLLSNRILLSCLICIVSESLSPWLRDY